MLYLLDANIIIHASNTYYPIDRVPEFWAWLVHMAKSGQVKMPFEIIDEVKNGTQRDQLYDWIRDKDNYKALLLDENVNPGLVQKVINEGYAKDLTDDQIEGLGRDPILIAYALGRTDRCVVTNESRTNKQRHNRKVPDVCSTFGVHWCNAFTFNRNLNFRTSWNA